MCRSPLLTLSLAWLFMAISLGLPVQAGARSAETSAAGAEQLPPLQVSVDKDKVDLERHRLEVKLSRPADRIELKVYGESGRVLAEVTERFSGKPAGAPLLVRWVPEGDEPVAKIDVYAYDTAGYYKAVRLVPWSVSIPHDDVVFATNSAAIQASEESKLQASLKLVQQALATPRDLGPITLFIAGHSDTRGTASHNLNLSRRRAQAIAAWFRAHGLRMPIAYEGFGEHSLKVKTADEVDEPANRRVDYVLSVETPVFKSTGLAPAWKRL